MSKVDKENRAVKFSSNVSSEKPKKHKPTPKEDIIRKFSNCKDSEEHGWTFHSLETWKDLCKSEAASASKESIKNEKAAGYVSSNLGKTVVHLLLEATSHLLTNAEENLRNGMSPNDSCSDVSSPVKRGASLTPSRVTRTPATPGTTPGTNTKTSDSASGYSDEYSESSEDYSGSSATESTRSRTRSKSRAALRRSYRRKHVWKSPSADDGRHGMSGWAVSDLADAVNATNAVLLTFRYQGVAAGKGSEEKHMLLREAALEKMASSLEEALDEIKPEANGKPIKNAKKRARAQALMVEEMLQSVLLPAVPSAVEYLEATPALAKQRGGASAIEPLVAHVQTILSGQAEALVDGICALVHPIVEATNAARADRHMPGGDEKLRKNIQEICEMAHAALEDKVTEYTKDLAILLGGLMNDC